ncbi:LTA synthase family protein [Caballeronia sp. Lep1P3]|uniref:LTA synthase family protein n=1 Tax=Caballeronia sp. Lep1P3 TaxID=2878150 RepID=UPI001FCF9F77|nr:LTA synthase family protein [Caballeronia sp. Lep1P3]
MLAASALAAATVALSFGVEAIAVPRCSLRRPFAAMALHASAVAVVAGCALALTARPVFSACAALAWIALLAVISNAKFESLREPFVFTDLSLFSQAFSHPRLYLPFLSAGKVAGIVAGVTAAATGFLLEDAASATVRCVAALVAIACGAFALVLSRRLALSLTPMADQQAFGFFATFVAYLLNGMRRTEREAFARAADAAPLSQGRPDAGACPDVIVIQSESWFDARRLGDFVLSAPYAHLDRIKDEALEHGRLTVPAWGANTMRSEFAMLTGLASDALGYSRFYPYMYVRRATASLAAWFKRGGYRTCAVHPYYGDFFGRRRALRFMQFDRFCDIRAFGDAPRVGPYVGDASVADALIALLDESASEPLFAFAITMENHGPLHLEAVAPGESAARHTLGDDARWRDLTAYLRHVEHADAMIGKLTDYLKQRERPTVLCFYGDHVPAMTSVFDALGVEPVHSDYFVWRNFADDGGAQRHARVEDLGFAIRRAMKQPRCVVTPSRETLQQCPA